jgi:aryl-alcohol dehydrogenase-like predicted oxidoreductase
VVGRALKDFPRDSYVLAAKVFFPMGEGPNDRGLSRKHIMEQCHASLRRLGTDYIDLYQCHRYDPETPLEETLRALDNLVTQGKVLYVGVSEWSATQIADAVYLARALNLDGIVSNQPIYNERARSIVIGMTGPPTGRSTMPARGPHRVRPCAASGRAGRTSRRS